MKIIPTTYTFNAGAKTITCPDFATIERIQLITNVTTWVIVYQFNNVNKLGTLLGTTLTLVYDTTAMNDTDDLMIVMDDGIAPATEEKQDTLISTAQAIQELSEMNVLLKSILSAIILPRNADMSQNANRVTIAWWSVSINANQDLRNVANLQAYNWVFQTQQASFANEIAWWYLAQRSTIN